MDGGDDRDGRDGEDGKHHGDQDRFGGIAVKRLPVEGGKPGFDAVTQNAAHNDTAENGKNARTKKNGADALRCLVVRLFYGACFGQRRGGAWQDACDGNEENEQHHGGKECRGKERGLPCHKGEADGYVQIE